MSKGTIVSGGTDGDYNVEVEMLDGDNQKMQVWCADLTEDLTGSVGVIEIAGDIDKGVNIQPGYEGNAAYDADRDGQMKQVQKFPDTSPTGEVYWNWAMRPGWQKWRPNYRYGTINSIDYTADTCNIALDACLSTDTPDGRELDVNQTTTLTDVPIEYMECDSVPFEVGDKVLIAFEDNDWDNPKVIGFKEEPKSCSSYIYIQCGTQCVVWDIAKSTYAEHVMYNEALGGGRVTSWPVDVNDISEWKNSRKADDNAQELFDIDWDADPTRSAISPHDDGWQGNFENCESGVNSGYGTKTRTTWGYFSYSCAYWWDQYYLGKTDTILSCDGKEVHPNTRIWNFLDEQITTHIVGNNTFQLLESICEGPWGHWMRVETSLSFVEYESWSGQKITVLNQAGGTLRFYRHIKEGRSDSAECTKAYPHYSFCRENDHTSGYSNKVEYIIPDIGGDSVFSIKDTGGSESTSWHCSWVSSNPEVWDCGDGPSPISYKMSSNPLGAFDRVMGAAVCEATRYEDIKMMDAIGYFHEDRDWVIAIFSRIKSEDWTERGSHSGPCSEMFTYEVFAATAYGDGAATRNITTALAKQSALSFTIKSMLDGSQPSYPVIKVLK